MSIIKLKHHNTNIISIVFELLKHIIPISQCLVNSIDPEQFIFDDHHYIFSLYKLISDYTCAYNIMMHDIIKQYIMYDGHIVQT